MQASGIDDWVVDWGGRDVVAAAVFGAVQERLTGCGAGQSPSGLLQCVGTLRIWARRER